MGQPQSDSAVFVVRRPGGWTLTRLPAADPDACSLDDLLALIYSDDERDAPVTEVRAVADGRPSPTPEPVDVVEPQWIVVGRLVPGGVVVEDGFGGTVRLDAGDLRLLDRIDGPITVAELAASEPVGSDHGDNPDSDDAAGDNADDDDADDEQLSRRLARLIGAGVVRQRSAVEPAVGSGVEHPVEHGVDGAAVGETGSADSGEIAAPTGGSGLGQRLRFAFEHSSKLRRLTGRPPIVSSVDATAPAAAIAPTATNEQVAPTSTPAPPPPELAHGSDDGRIPVYAIWHTDVGPMLSLGMLTAAIRHWSDGELNETFEIRRPETVESFLHDIATRSGPAVLLCSDYVWSLEANVDAARRAKALNDDLIVFRGGPSIPKYDEDLAVFLAEFADVADVAVHGEGELTLIELLESLRAGGGTLDHERLADVAGISFRAPGDGSVIRTAERPRIAELDTLPSPYLTGEFDHIPADAWHICLSIETNRGCPYGCTFCDWGSATMSRIRKFGSERVAAEIAWAAERGQNAIQMCDANFGIMARDVETAERLAEVKRATGYPLFVSWTPAKNTTKHLTKIMDALLGAKIGVSASLSPQSTDPTTLEAIERSNISLDHYLALAADFRRRGHPLQGDLLLGLPGQTFETYKADLQFMLDHEIVARTWPVQVLPNAPMNAPEYRERFRIEADERHLITSTSTFTVEDRREMLRLRKVGVIAEQLGALRHVLRHLQWDHELLALDVLDRLRRTLADDPLRYPTVAWTFEYFDLHPTVAVGWSSFYDEIRRFITDELGVEADSGLDCVLTLQQFLMPTPGREFPEVITLAHDYVSYYRSATEQLYVDGRPGTPAQPLVTYGPIEFTIEADPLELCSNGLTFGGESRDETMQGDFYVLIDAAYELLSPLTSTVLPMVTRLVDEETLHALLTSRMPAAALAARVDSSADETLDELDDETGLPATSVDLTTKP